MGRMREFMRVSFPFAGARRRRSATTPTAATASTVISPRVSKPRKSTRITFTTLRPFATAGSSRRRRRSGVGRGAACREHEGGHERPDAAATRRRARARRGESAPQRRQAAQHEHEEEHRERLDRELGHREVGRAEERGRGGRCRSPRRPARPPPRGASAAHHRHGRRHDGAPRRASIGRTAPRRTARGTDPRERARSRARATVVPKIKSRYQPRRPSGAAASALRSATRPRITRLIGPVGARRREVREAARAEERPVVRPRRATPPRTSVSRLRTSAGLIPSQRRRSRPRVPAAPRSRRADERDGEEPGKRPSATLRRGEEPGPSHRASGASWAASASPGRGRRRAARPRAPPRRDHRASDERPRGGRPRAGPGLRLVEELLATKPKSGGRPAIESADADRPAKAVSGMSRASPPRSAHVARARLVVDGAHDEEERGLVERVGQEEDHRRARPRRSRCRRAGSSVPSAPPSCTRGGA